jgi:hypothetical protein
MSRVFIVGDSVRCIDASEFGADVAGPVKGEVCRVSFVPDDDEDGHSVIVLQGYLGTWTTNNFELEHESLAARTTARSWTAG